ncbi:MAG: hypothetical protein EXS63_04950 [Candidatus Omnitrophica bacterium]|nr:hypothetical protein [Candidatus Omnitrophota bacterium]
MIHETRKLQRGLKDISQLFNPSKSSKPEKAPEASNAAYAIKSEDGSISCLAIFHPVQPSESRLYCALAASSMASPDRPCTIVSLGKSPQPLTESNRFSSRFQRVSCSWDQGRFLHYLETEVSESLRQSAKVQLIFLDFQEDIFGEYVNLIKMLDHWIFILQPTSESILECYRHLKRMSSLRLPLSYGFFYEGDRSDPRGEILFDKFSLLVSRHLGLTLTWWGYGMLPKEGREPYCEMNIQELPKKKEQPQRRGIEKQAFVELNRLRLNSQELEEVIELGLGLKQLKASQNFSQPPYFP